MRTRKLLHPEGSIVYSCELERCPHCGGRLKIAYQSGAKTVQTLEGVWEIAQRTKRCADRECTGHETTWPSAAWQQVAPGYGTYGWDVIVQLGWQRQWERATFSEIHERLQEQVQISASQVRYLYRDGYLALRACLERQGQERLQEVAASTGLILSLDGLAPEGGEPQLWVVREVQTDLVLRSGWLSRQDQGTFQRFLQPLQETGWAVRAVLSDKQRGLEPVVAKVFPDAAQAWCQVHYLANAAEPIAAADEAMKVTLRKQVRETVGEVIRQEQEEAPGVLTVTGVAPTPQEEEAGPEQEPPGAEATVSPAAEPAQERQAIVQDLLRRVRYLLTLKGRPPLRLAGVEMVEGLQEVEACLRRLLVHHPDACLEKVQQGLQVALALIEADYRELCIAVTWLEQIRAILDPEDNPPRNGEQVKQELGAALEEIEIQGQASPRLQHFAEKIIKTTHSYEDGLFHSYDIPELPRTNNDLESEFRALQQRLLRTTGSKGWTRRLIQREGAWEVLARPASPQEMLTALEQVDPHEFQQERQRLRTHRSRFRLHTRSSRQAAKQLASLEQRWMALPTAHSP